MGSADTIWIFQGDINPPTTTTTSTSSTTTTTSTSTSTTTTTTTTAAPLCDLNGPSAIINITTTTTTTAIVKTALISPSSAPSDACSEVISVAVLIINPAGSGSAQIVSTNSVVFTSLNPTTPFVGDGGYYKIKYDGSILSTSSPVNSSGEVSSIITICP